MWLFTKFGFFSIVCARTSARAGAPVDPDTVMVRARKREHLDALIARFVHHGAADDRSDVLDWLKATVVESKSTDYPFRLFLPKAVWADAAHDLAAEIEWDNFKHEVGKETDDADYLDALHDVWAVGRRMSR